MWVITTEAQTLYKLLLISSALAVTHASRRYSDSIRVTPGKKTEDEKM
jgi:hypothetical protein